MDLRAVLEGIEALKESTTQVYFLLKYWSLKYCLCFFRQLSRSSSNLVLDQKPAEVLALAKQTSADLLKNGFDHQTTTTENASFHQDVNSFRSLYVQRKRKSALEINRGPGRPSGPFPDSDGVVVMRKSRSVHDLINSGKEVSWFSDVAIRIINSKQKLI